MTAPYEMSDDEWRDLCQIILLHDAARSSIEFSIFTYRSLAKISYKPAASRSNIMKAQQALNKAHKLTSVLCEDPLALQVISSNIERPTAPTPQHAAKDYLLKFLDSLARATSALEKSTSQIKSARPGASTKAQLVALLVYHVSMIMMTYRGHAITRSGKKTDRSRDYLEAICKLADPKIPPSSVEEAMKQIIRTSNKISPRKAG